MTAVLPVETERLLTAYHELGHAYVDRHAGLHVTDVRVVVAQGRVEGYCNTPPVHSGDREMLDAYVVGLFAGPIAEIKAIPLVGGDPDVLYAAAEEGAAGDREQWRRCARHCGLTEKQARDAAGRLVRRYWPRITRRAARLAARGRMTAGAL